MGNPARLWRLAHAPAVHARREGQITGVEDGLQGLLTVGGTRGVGMESICRAKLVLRPRQAFNHRRYLGAKLAHPLVIEECGQDMLDVVATYFEFDRIVAAADIGLDGFDPCLDRSVARKPSLGFP